MDLINIGKIAVAIAIITAGCFFIKQGVNAYNELPYKVAYNNYERAVYRQAYVIGHYRTALKYGAEIPSEAVKAIQGYVHAQANKADSLYSDICQFPESMGDVKEAACLLNVESLKIRKRFHENFKGIDEEESITEDLISIFNEIRDKVYDCNIDQDTEDTEMKGGSTIDLVFSFFNF